LAVWDDTPELLIRERASPRCPIDTTVEATVSRAADAAVAALLLFALVPLALDFFDLRAVVVGVSNRMNDSPRTVADCPHG
jgi:hypothetical protein